MSFFVVVDRMGVHVYEYNAEIQIRPGEVLIGRFDSLQKAEAVEAQTDPSSVFRKG
jgi:hypothetical protein